MRSQSVSHTGPAQVGTGIASTGILIVNKPTWRTDLSWESRLRDAADALARHAEREGRRQEELRGVWDPPPIRLRVTAAPADLVAQRANILGTGLDDPGAPPPDLDLDGHLDDMDAVYRRSGGRLVVLGERGSGKSVVAQRLALKLLEARRGPEDPVPLVLRLHTWDPAVSLRDWLVASLADGYDYNGLRTTGPRHRALAEELVDRGLLLPVLDGFDEISPGLHAGALRELSRTPVPLVLTSTTDAYARAVREGRTLARAAVVVLSPVTPVDLRRYLPRTAHNDASAAHWTALLAPGLPEPLRQALSTPLMVGLTRAVYSDGHEDPGDLFDTERFPTPGSVETHLLERFVPAVYERGASWRAEDVRRWLRYLARRPGRRDIAWWNLADTVPRFWRTLAFAVPGAALGAVTGRLVFGSGEGTAGVAVLLLVLGAVTGWSRSPVPARMELRVSGRARHVFAQLSVGPVGGGAAGLVGYPAVREWGWLALAAAGAAASGLGGLLSGWARRRDPEAEARPLRKEIGFGVVGGAMGGAAIGAVCLLAGLRAPTGSFGVWVFLGVELGLSFALGAALLAPTRLDTVVTPQALLTSNRRYALFQAVTVGTGYGLVPALLFDPFAGLVCGVAVGVAFGIGAHAWGRWLVVVRCWLPLTGRLPWRLRSFLDDAHERGVLRQAGAVYVFRHGRVQDTLAAIPPSPARGPVP